MCADVQEDETGLGARLALLDKLKRRERQETRFRAASVLAHLIGTPLNVIIGRAALIRANPTGDEVERNARKIEEQVNKAADRIHRLMDTLCRAEVQPEARAVEAVLADAVTLYGPLAKSRGVHLSFQNADLSGLFVEDGDTSLAVLSSLLSMALEAAKPEQCVTLRCVGSQQELVIELDMPGVEPPLARLDSMEPQHEPDPERAEQIQVLSVCHAMATGMGGKLEIRQKEPGIAGVAFRCAGVQRGSRPPLTSGR